MERNFWSEKMKKGIWATLYQIGYVSMPVIVLDKNQKDKFFKKKVRKKK